MDPSDQTARAGRAFSRGIGLLVTGIGAVAILGPEAAHVAATRLMGILLIVTGVLGVLSPAAHRSRAPRRAIWIWSIVALAVGLVLMAAPIHGLAAAGTLVGALLVGHGVAAASVVLRRWRKRDAILILGSLAAALLALVGLALIFGERPGDKVEQVLIGVDMVMFGAYLLLGHELAEAATPSSRSPSTSSR